VHLELETRGDTEAILDPGLIDQLLWNLVDNAVKFTPSGGRVSVALRGATDTVEIRVADTGPGLPPEEVDRIFERFYRADASRTPHTDSSGTGLGLSIVRAIAEVHGGSASARNREASGAEFIVRLPKAPGQPAEGPRHRSDAVAIPLHRPFIGPFAGFDHAGEPGEGASGQ
jgi:signal transduction histidine kinase